MPVGEGLGRDVRHERTAQVFPAALGGRLPASHVRRQWEKERAQGPAGVAWMRCTDTHDVAADTGARRNETRWGHRRAECGIALSFALDGVPMLWMGQDTVWLTPDDPDDELLFLRRAPDGTTYRCRFNCATGDGSIALDGQP